MSENFFLSSQEVERGQGKAPPWGLSLQEEPSNVTFTIDGYEISATDCTREVMVITKMRFLQRRRPAALARVFTPRLGVD